jgi:hypothetical protein
MEFSQNEIGQKTILNISNLENGIHFIEVFDGKNFSRKTMIKGLKD